MSRVGGNAQIKAIRQVAGTLRLELAQYRELAAFAQFGSDLDKATQAQLARGERLTEILKQDQYRPLGVVQQMIIIFAGTQGFVDDLPVGEIRVFREDSCTSSWKPAKNPLVQRLIQEKALNEETRAQLLDAMKEFKEKYCAERGGEAERAGAN